MTQEHSPFQPHSRRAVAEDDHFSPAEVGLANRNSGILLETLTEDITPTGAHYLLNHFDVPLIDKAQHTLRFHGVFQTPFELSMEDIHALPQVSIPVTMECAGNGRAGLSPRAMSMPWRYEAVGTSVWSGTPLLPLIEKAAPANDVVDISFTGADFGYDKGEGHYFGRSLTPAQLRELDVLLVHSMNGQPLLPQHGAPLRIIVPGWYGMASVKWLGAIEALTQPFDGFQQVRTYQFRQSVEDPGIPIQGMRVKSLMVPPGIPDWSTRIRRVTAGPNTLSGRAWSGLGQAIDRVDVEIEGQWHCAQLHKPDGKYAWTRWTLAWDAQPGEYHLRCRATDAQGNTQPLDAPWDIAGFANNAAHSVHVFVE
jgi:DMSO/TMAO reductase YedYZ molybdopterin-dependent catalytic subunit